MVSLVGYTGFVGSNIAAKTNFDRLYNSSNITQAFGTKPDMLVFAGLRAEKYLANSDPDGDYELILEAERNIERTSPENLVLISTIDVFKNTSGVTESSEPETDGLAAYGLNRYKLEQWVRANYPEALIVRLPALFGSNLKKNFIYDYINVIPFMLKREKFEELSAKDKELQKYYDLQPNGFYKCKTLSDTHKEYLKDRFKMLGFTALNFTDSRSVFQFYPLFRLWDDIQTALNNKLKIFHAATEPVEAAEIYHYLTGKIFNNEVAKSVPFYNFKTEFAELFGGENGYLMKKTDVLESIKKFVDEVKI